MAIDKVGLQDPDIKEICYGCGDNSFKGVWNYLRKAEHDAKGRAEAYRLRKGTSPAGFMAFIESPHHLRLVAIATKEVHHGKGFGLELLVALMRIAKERGKERITFRTKIPRWWTKRGAVAVGKHDNGETEMEICL